jgi:hypothetical protein
LSSYVDRGGKRGNCRLQFEPEEIAFDESGNTGDNLLDRVQPIYALASIHAAEADAQALIDEVAPGLPELKYSSLRRSRGGREAVMRVLRSELIAPGLARVTAMHKPFSTVARMFDYVMEPTLFNGGMEVYDQGLHIAFSNILWRNGAHACGADRWEELLRSFVVACRGPTMETAERLVLANAACVAACTDETVEKLLILIPPEPAWALPRIAADMGHGIGVRDLLDPAATSLIENCIFWPEHVGPIVVLHDESSIVSRWRAKLEVLASAEAEQEVGEYWANRVPYPLAIEEVRMVRSSDCARVQLSDVIAGATVTWLSQYVPGQDPRGDFVRALTEAGIEELIAGEVWPQPENEGQRF